MLHTALKRALTFRDLIVDRSRYVINTLPALLQLDCGVG